MAATKTATMDCKSRSRVQRARAKPATPLKVSGCQTGSLVGSLKVAR